MTILNNPSGCDKVRHRIYRAPRPSLLQRLARAFVAPAAAMCEHLDNLGSQS
jgi:hypothetical protein